MRPFLLAAAVLVALAAAFALGRWSHDLPSSAPEDSGTGPETSAGAPAGAAPGPSSGELPSGELPDATAGAAVSRSQVTTGEQPLRGKWRRARSEPGETEGGAAAGAEPSAEAAAELTAVPYLQGYRPAAGATGVTVNAPPAEPGLNLVLSAHGAEALLMTLDGTVVHRWRAALRRVWPDLPDNANLRKLDYWRRARPQPDGSLLAIFEIHGLVKLDRDSQLLWAYRSDVHHDLFVAPDESIWVLDRRGKVDPRLHRTEPVLEDLITVLEPEGSVRRQISILDAFLRSPFAPMVWNRPVAAGDIFHTNTLQRLDGSLEHLHPAFREGNLLISVLQLSTVAILDPRTEEIVWTLSGLFRKQHQPILLPGPSDLSGPRGSSGASLLVFDNRGPGGERSRVLEIDAITQEVLWSYGGTDDSFFSRTLGTCQRLPGGNTLIVESENGRALEVTPDGTIVWEYRNPHRAGTNDEFVAALMDVVRLPVGFGGWGE
ncbi:MAG: arylsulfotransferase family protein [Acidobacteriota bacterium]|nr:arylsulfotransferase family protein [Acidobacteriota bacterium]